ncbi:TPA: helix-turn-helix domain-containing protein [Burkholderia cepacia]|uniref:helix-turn-helix domain-containing protein n=1 Tax=Burkholderia cepacia TaxID=292 RepID=UPI0011B213F5|nr:helix-turn-helix domain-containing protein [Burkholderia cepacia]HDR9512164.1 helix-turn-helix domain-containing protein [Burkholderia cepacia]
MKVKCTSNNGNLNYTTQRAMRHQVVKAVREGQHATSAATADGVNERSVYRWLADSTNGGQSTLLAKPIPGRPPRVTAEKMRGQA